MDPNLTSSPITSSPITSSPISSSQDNDLNKASDYLLNVYDKLTYGDLYGSSVLIVIISTIVIIFAVCFSMLIQNKQEIADNWTNLRCKPQYMPFAGYIMPEEGKTPGQTSYENFQYCLQEQVVNMTTEATKPHVYLLNALNSTFVSAGNAANNLRYGMTEMRTNIGAFASDLLSRIMNVTAPIYKMFLAVKDIVGKIQGALTAGLFIFDGAFKALQAFIGAFFMIIVSVLGIQLAIIAVLWILPLTIPMAMSLSIPIAIFAIFFAVLTGLTAKIFNINPIKIPSINVCFDKNTLFTMDDGETKKIINVNAGDILADGTKVTAKFKIDTCGSRMFSLGGVIVSETHIVKYSDKWIYVCEHPEAIEIRGYKEPYIYCLNTSSKEIILNGFQFLDWDDLHDVRLEKVQNKINSRNLFDIHRKLDIGFSSDFVVELISENKNICDVNIGDKLKTGGIVYGLVEIDGSDLMLYDKLYDDKIYNLLSTNKKFSSNGKVINDYNHIIDSIG
jgi:hypothetical protein